MGVPINEILAMRRLTIDKNSSKDEPQIPCAKSRRPNPKGYLLRNSIYMAFCKRQTFKD